MPTDPSQFTARIARLKADMVAQSRRVQALIEAAFDAAFVQDTAAAERAIRMDEPIDMVDVEIEKAAVQLLTDATAAGAALRPEHLRLVLTIVKVNNELERIADAGVTVAEMVQSLQAQKAQLPETIRVITNSVIGILRDTGTCFDRDNAQLAKIVLASEDAVEEFKKAINRDAQVQVSTGRMTVDTAFLLMEIANHCETMAVHCTNIAEQVLYMTTGKIVRHMKGHWEEVPQNAAE